MSTRITSRPTAVALALPANATPTISLATRRVLATAALLFLTAAVALAQGGSAFFLGAHTGVNGSKFRFTEDLSELYQTSDRLAGLNVGLDAGFQVGNWTFATGLAYLQKGGTYETGTFTDEEGRTGYFSARERLHFLNVPVTLGYSGRLANKIGYTVAAGPSFNFGITGRIDETTEYFEEDFPVVQNQKVAFGSGVNDDYRGTQVDFRLQPGVFFDVNRNSRITLNAVFDYGTKDAFNPRYRQANAFFDDFRGTLTGRMRAVTLGYQYRIPFADRY